MMKCLFLFCLFFIHGTGTLYATELYEETALLMEARVHAKVAGIAPAGEVAVLERKGFWVKLQAGKSLQGWAQLSQVRMQEKIQWMRPIDVLHDTGRLTGN